MTQTPPGWYQDPGAPPGAAPHVRYWDGSAWTHHVQPAPGAPPVYGAPPAYPTPAYGATPTPIVTWPTTPDGERLAGWWWRVLASVLDGVFLGIAVQLISLPVQVDVQRELNDLNDRYLNTTPGGTIDFSAFSSGFLDVYRDHIVGLLLVPTVFSLAYFVGFLRWKGATPGKLICGLRVRLRERPGRLPWSTIGVRTLVQTILPWFALIAGVLSGSVAAAALLYLAAMTFYVVDALWAAGSKKRQALHDIAARTNVVKTR
jgi:uncharacterized RDD family membrane protein YckC